MKIPYRVEHRNVKYPRLEFKDLQLLIVLPHYMRDPTEIIARRKAWIERKWGQIQEAIKNSGGVEGFMIFGKKYAIENADVKRPTIDHTQKKITLNPENPKHIEQIIEQLKELLRNKIEEIMAEYSVKMGFKPEKIIIRRQKTKWGSCSTSGNISLNLKLVCLPEETIRYIIHHEVTHLKYRRHNRAFWQAVSQEYPNYRQIEKEMLQQWFKIEKLLQNLVEPKNV
ncbi:MAG: YgjP-like metallopeptidase domain-containing protein [Thermoproteota archaeon]